MLPSELKAVEDRVIALLEENLASPLTSAGERAQIAAVIFDHIRKSREAHKPHTPDPVLPVPPPRIPRPDEMWPNDKVPLRPDPLYSTT